MTEQERTERRACVAGALFAVPVFVVLLLSAHCLARFGLGRARIPPAIAIVLAYSGHLTTALVYRKYTDGSSRPSGMRRPDDPPGSRKILAVRVTWLQATQLAVVLICFVISGAYIALTAQ